MDSLGLDQPIKLGKASKTAKVTDELIFNPSRGIPQIMKTYPKLTKSIRRRDSKFNDSVKKSNRSKKSEKALRVNHECENLQKVLEYYQLWCHGFFPRANFNDCIALLRSYSSPRLKLYRRDLLDNEIRKQRIEKGIIVEAEQEHRSLADLDDDLYGPPVEEHRNEASDSDDDWGFMNVNLKSSNGLFVGENDANDENDKYNAPAPEGPSDEFPEDDYEDHEEELDVMREMGM